MNERIKELLEQCETKYTYREDGYNYVGHRINAEKFANLIVKEMCGMMEQCQSDCDTGDASETNWGYISILQDWIDRFKEHFGVEE